MNTPVDALAVSGYPAGGVLALEHREPVAAAVIDTNGDGQVVVVDTYWFDQSRGRWEAGSSAGAGSEGFSPGPTTYAYGRGIPGDTVRITYRGRADVVDVSPSGWWVWVCVDDDWERAGTLKVDHIPNSD